MVKCDHSDHMTDTTVTKDGAVPRPSLVSSPVVLALAVLPAACGHRGRPRPLRRPGEAGGDTLGVALHPGVHPGVPPARAHRQPFPARGQVERVEASSTL